ncbi:MAG: hypothetical protein CR217_10510 [Beijerinckiaceae bacterium]|nr:MAG: hypothetical protein CR217_10510 [Beijerinckiaceae bacterium]
MTTHGPVRWRQREASRAIRAVEQAGLRVSGVEVTPNGTIRVLTPVDGKQEVAQPEIGIARNAADVVAARLAGE